MARWVDNRTAEEKQADQKKKLDSIMQQVVDGTKAVFESERYKEMLTVMSKFHNYSINNIILIHLQRPDATLVAGYQAWKKKLNRQVRKGEKGIVILAPAGKRVREYVQTDEHGNPVLDENGEPVKVAVASVPFFTTRRVFDVSQTDGEPLTTIYNGPLQGSVNRFEDLKRVLMELSPLPVSFEAMEGKTAMGYMSRTKQRIVVRTGISELQTIKTLVHEIAHAQLHNNAEDGKPVKLDRRVRETEAESVAFVVCTALGLDTSDYSFPYLAGWASGKELKELRGSLKRIRERASENIKFIAQRMEELEKTQEAILEGGALTYRIYQVKEEAKDLRFMDYGWFEKKGIAVNCSDYNCVYTGQLPAGGKDSEQILNSLFETFNVNHPADFTGHSLSVSDVVVLVDAEGREQAYFVDTFGFREVPDFLREQERVQDQQLFFKVENRYLLLQPLEQGQGWDYNLLDADFQMDEGGHFDLRTSDEVVSAVCDRYGMAGSDRVQMTEKDFEQLQQLYTEEPSVTLRLFQGDRDLETRTPSLLEVEQFFHIPDLPCDSAQLQLTYVKDGLLHHYESARRLHVGDTNLREQLLEDGAVRRWLDKELLPFLNAHLELSGVEREALRTTELAQQNAVRQNVYRAYSAALKDYVLDARVCLNTGADDMPERPVLQAFIDLEQQRQRVAPSQSRVTGSLSDRLQRAQQVAEQRNRQQTAPAQQRSLWGQKTL